MENIGVLVLADGSIFEGISVGVTGHICGEVVFNTAQTGYQEILTDCSYAEQIVVFTQPHIGNVGINPEDMESDRVWASGAIMRSFSAIASNWRSEQTLESFFQQQQVIAISEIDTRALTEHLRVDGSQIGCLMAGDINVERALGYAKNFPALLGKDLAQVVTTRESYVWTEPSWHHPKPPVPSTPRRVVVYDFGIKRGTLRNLVDYGCEVVVVPATMPYQKVLALKPDGILLSNGPGDPAACTYAIENIKALLKMGIPMMAICLGHQLLALASGAQTEKMAFGHHGANHPVFCEDKNAVAISSQNHNFVVSAKNLPNCLRVTHQSLFDGTIAGIERTDVPVFGFQGHPEASPGPTELTEMFHRFIDLIEVHRAQKN